MPRWLVLAWLWATLAVAILESTDCPDWIDHGLCMGVGNTVSLAFELFPATLVVLFLAWWGNNIAAALAGVAVCTLVCHFGVRKLVPRSIGLNWFVPAVIVWFVLGWVTLCVGVWQLFDRPAPLFQILLGPLTG